MKYVYQVLDEFITDPTVMYKITKMTEDKDILYAFIGGAIYEQEKNEYGILYFQDIAGIICNYYVVCVRGGTLTNKLSKVAIEIFDIKKKEKLITNVSKHLIEFLNETNFLTWHLYLPIFITEKKCKKLSRNDFIKVNREYVAQYNKLKCKNQSIQNITLLHYFLGKEYLVLTSNEDIISKKNIDQLLLSYYDAFYSNIATFYIDEFNIIYHYLNSCARNRDEAYTKKFYIGEALKVVTKALKKDGLKNYQDKSIDETIGIISNELEARKLIDANNKLQGQEQKYLMSSFFRFFEQIISMEENSTKKIATIFYSFDNIYVLSTRTAFMELMSKLKLHIAGIQDILQIILKNIFHNIVKSEEIAYLTVVEKIEEYGNFEEFEIDIVDKKCIIFAYVMYITKTLNFRKFLTALEEHFSQDKQKIGMLRSIFGMYKNLDNNFLINITIKNYRDCFNSGLLYYY